MSNAREAILQRIGKAKGVSSADAAALAYAGIQRTYQQRASMARGAIIDLLIERLIDYDANVYRASASEVGARVQEVLAQRSVSTVIVPEGLPQEWMQGAHFIADTGEGALALDRFTSVMTTATFGIAETGTIVLQNAPGQGRRAITLVPDYHLCIIRASQVVETVVEAMRLLEPTKHLPTTFFSGPSATADIEMTRIKGVHGPRFVDVVLIGDEAL